MLPPTPPVHEGWRDLTVLGRASLRWVVCKYSTSRLPLTSRSGKSPTEQVKLSHITDIDNTTTLIKRKCLEMHSVALSDAGDVIQVASSVHRTAEGLHSILLSLIGTKRRFGCFGARGIA